MIYSKSLLSVALTTSLLSGIVSCSPGKSAENQSDVAALTSSEVNPENVLESSSSESSRFDESVLDVSLSNHLSAGKYTGKLKCGSYVPNDGIYSTGANTFDYTWITVDGGTCNGTYESQTGTYIGLEADIILSNLPVTLFRSVDYSFDFNVLQRPNVTINEYSYTISKTGTGTFGRTCYSLYNATSVLTSTKTVRLGFMQGNGNYSYTYNTSYGNHTDASLTYSVKGLRDSSKELSITSDLSYSTYSRGLQKQFESTLNLTGYPSQSGSENTNYYITYGPVASGTGVTGAPFTCYIETDYVKSVSFTY